MHLQIFTFPWRIWLHFFFCLKSECVRLCAWCICTTYMYSPISGDLLGSASNRHLLPCQPLVLVLGDSQAGTASTWLTEPSPLALTSFSNRCSLLLLGSTQPHGALGVFARDSWYSSAQGKKGLAGHAIGLPLTVSPPLTLRSTHPSLPVCWYQKDFQQPP